MCKTKDEVMLEALVLIILLIILWLVSIVGWGYSLLRMHELKNELSNMSITNDNQFNQEIIKEEVNYMSMEEKSVKTDSSESDNKLYLGKFKITHYCACKKCCGPNAQGITASGKKVQENKTIAVDTKIIKLGSKVYIDEYGEMEAQDTGSAIKGNVIDVYVADHNQALNLGVVYKDVYLVKGE